VYGCVSEGTRHESKWQAALQGAAEDLDKSIGLIGKGWFAKTGKTQPEPGRAKKLAQALGKRSAKDAPGGRTMQSAQFP